MAQFSFKEFTNAAGLSEESIQILSDQRIDSERRLRKLDYAKIAGLQLKQGEAISLEDECEQRWPKGTATIKQESVDNGASGGSTSTQESTKQTTKSLAADAELNKAVSDFIGSTQNLGGIKDLLTLSELRASVEAKSKGEKPWLIGDYLASNILKSYIEDESDEEIISSTTKLVHSHKAKKPSVQEYTPDIWAAASFRIIQHMFKSGTSQDVIKEYIAYSEMIADYLGLYRPHGVFMLDYEHRHRVAKEGRAWSDISRHDENRYLEHVRKSEPVQKSKKVKPRFSSGRANSRADTEGRAFCVNYNKKSGCTYNPCRYSHACSNAGCGAKHSAADCKS